MFDRCWRSLLFCIYNGDHLVLVWNNFLSYFIPVWFDANCNIGAPYLGLSRSSLIFGINLKIAKMSQSPLSPIYLYTNHTLFWSFLVFSDIFWSFLFWSYSFLIFSINLKLQICPSPPLSPIYLYPNHILFWRKFPSLPCWYKIRMFFL